MIKNFLAYDLAVELHSKVETIQLKHSMKDQLERAAQSVVLNLAEGSAKPTRRDQLRFYSIAFGSVKEIQAVFDLIHLEDAKTLDLADHIAACLYRLIYK